MRFDTLDRQGTEIRVAGPYWMGTPHASKATFPVHAALTTSPRLPTATWTDAWTDALSQYAAASPWDDGWLSRGLAVRCTAASSSRFFRREFSNALAGTTDGWCPGIIPRYQISRGEFHGRCRTNTRYMACGILLSCSIFPCTLQCYGILELSCTFYVNACCLRGESNSPVTTAGMPCPGLEAG